MTKLEYDLMQQFKEDSEMYRNYFRWRDAINEKPNAAGHYLVYVEGVGGYPDYCDVAYFFLPVADFCRRVKYWMPLPEPPAGSP